jgi:predicted  nucleic acid-binding Zn-ribbon protein
LHAQSSAAQPPSAQQPSAEARLRQQQDELEKLRRERATLEKRMDDLQRSARTLADEVENLEAQRLTTVRLVETLDKQLATITREVGDATAGLVQAEAELVSKKAILRKRMVDIYKRGRLFDV